LKDDQPGKRMTTQAPQPPRAEPGLREAAEQYRVTYRVFLAWGPDADWKLHKVGFDVELHAAANPDAPSEEPHIDDPARRAAYQALRRMAEWALGPTQPGVCFTFDDYTGRVVHEPAMHRWAVELVAHVLHCEDVRRPLDESEHNYVRDVKKRLASVDVPEK
jgi:hypothetical protein